MNNTKSYRDVVDFHKSLKALERAYISKENIDEKLRKVVEEYNQIAEDRKNTLMADLLKEKLVGVVTTYEGVKKAESLEASLQ